MKNPITGVCSLLALSLVGPVVAQARQVVNGPDLVATGTVISVGNSSMAIRTQDHGHAISFVVEHDDRDASRASTVGSRVRIAYHAVGTTGQVRGSPSPCSKARRSRRPRPPRARRRAPPAAQPPPPTRAPRTSRTPGVTNRLPRSCRRRRARFPAIGLLGLVALLASVSLRALERAR